jgi:hypothetical protein
VIAEPPSDSGAVHDTVALRAPRVACGSRGAVGTFAVDTEPDGELKLLEPTEFTAFTVNV